MIYITSTSYLVLLENGDHDIPEYSKKTIYLG